MPVGPSILWPVKARKSTPSAPDVDACGAARAGSRRRRRRRRRVWAAATIGREVVDGAEHVRHARDADEADAVEEPVELGQVEPVVLADGDVAQLDAALGGEHQPGHEVGVVLELGEQDRLVLRGGDGARRSGRRG